MNGLPHHRPRDVDVGSAPFSSPSEQDPNVPAPRLHAADVEVSATDRVPDCACPEAAS